MHDHAQSERERQEYEAERNRQDLATERQVNLVLEGAIRRIGDSSTRLGYTDIARDAIEAVRKLRESKR